MKGEDVSPAHYSDDSFQNELLKWRSDRSNFHYYHKIERDVIKVGWLECDAVYLNPFDNFKQ